MSKQVRSGQTSPTCKIWGVFVSGPQTVCFGKTEAMDEVYIFCEEKSVSKQDVLFDNQLV